MSRKEIHIHTCELCEKEERGCTPDLPAGWSLVYLYVKNDWHRTADFTNTSPTYHICNTCFGKDVPFSEFAKAQRGMLKRILNFWLRPESHEEKGGGE